MVSALFLQVYPPTSKDEVGVKGCLRLLGSLYL